MKKNNKEKINDLLNKMGMQKKDVNYMYDEINLLTVKDFKRLCFEIENDYSSDIYVVVTKSRKRCGYIVELAKVDNEQDINFLTENEYLRYCEIEDLNVRKEDRKNWK